MSGPATANRVQPWLDDGDLTLYHGDALKARKDELVTWLEDATRS